MNINNVPGHLAIRVFYPFSIIIFLLSIKKFISNKFSRLWLAIFLLLISYQSICHLNYFKKYSQSYKFDLEEKEMLSWFESLTPKDSVVLTASLGYNLLIPALTHNNVFLPYSQYSLASEKESFDRLYILYKFLGIPKERVEKMFGPNPLNQKAEKLRHFSYDDCGEGYFYYLKYKKTHAYGCQVSSSRLQEIVNDYENFSFKNSPNPFKYQADYLLLGPYEQKWAGFSAEKYSYLKLIKENKLFRLYKIQL